MKETRAAPDRFRRLPAGLLGFVLLSTAPLLAADPPATIAVSFQITAGTFRQGLGEQLPIVEAAMAAEVAEKACEAFAFLGWAAAPAGAAPAGADAVLIVSLDAERKSFGPEVYLSFWAPGASPAEPIDLFDESEDPVFRHDELQPNRDAEALAERLEEKLTELFRSQDFRERLMDRFLSRIVIGDDLHPVTGQKRLVVPLTESQLHAEDGSRLAAEFVFRWEEGGPLTCRLELEKNGSRRIDPFRGMVVTRVLLFEHESLAEPLLAWDEQIRKALEGKRSDSVRVFMREYLRQGFEQVGASLVPTIDPAARSCVTSLQPGR